MGTSQNHGVTSKCAKCKVVIDHGKAYELNNQVWHLECFTCLKCSRTLDYESGFLVLKDNALICRQCSRECSLCGQSLSDSTVLLIKTNETVCSRCFHCFKCSKPIEELKYAKTNKGLCCLKCYSGYQSKAYDGLAKRQSPGSTLVVTNEDEENLHGLQIKSQMLDTGAPMKSDNVGSIETPRSESKISSGSPQDSFKELLDMSWKLSDTLELTLTPPLSENLSMTFNHDHNNAIDADLYSLAKPVDLNKPRLGIKSGRRSSFIDSNKDRSPKAISLSRVTSIATPNKQTISISNSTNNISLGGTPVSTFAFNRTPKQDSAKVFAFDSTSSRKSPVLSSKPTFIAHNRTPSLSSITSPTSRSKHNSRQSFSYDAGFDTNEQNMNAVEANFESFNEFNEMEEYPNIVGADNISTELRLRTLRNEILELESLKKQLIQDVDNLQLKKITIQEDIRALDSEKQAKLDNKKQADDPSSVNVDETSKNDIKKDNQKSRFWKFLPVYNSNTHVLGIPKPMFKQGQLMNSDDSLTNNVIEDSAADSPPSSVDGSSNNVYKEPRRIFSPNLATPSTNINTNLDMIMCVVSSCIDFLESDEEHLKVEGIYRKSGSKIALENIEKIITNRKYTSEQYGNMVGLDVHVVTSLLKSQLRNLPEPIFTFSTYDEMIRYLKDNNIIEQIQVNKMETPSIKSLQTIEAIRHTLEKMPRYNIRLLQMLLQHMLRVSQYQHTNLMSLHNLALVLTPALLYDKTGERELEDLKERNFAVEFILNHYDEILDRI